jgi:hypothetical protein
VILKEKLITMLRMKGRAALVLVALISPAAMACFQYVPVETSSSPLGERVAVDLTDRGRASLAERLGPGVTRIEGVLTKDDGTDYTMSVWSIEQIGGLSSKWSGESVRFNRDYVGSVTEKKLSRVRTTVALSAAGVGLLLFAKSQNLLGRGTVDTKPDTSGGPASNLSFRIALP